MQTININEAKIHLSRLVDAVVAGEEVVIAKAGKPMVRLIPFIPVTKKRKLGLLAGRLTVPADFDAPMPDDVLVSFEGQ
jgi:prevent-host-death family protein